MRIDLVAGEYPPLQGGLGDFTRELARALGAAGHVPAVLTRAAPGAPSHETGAGAVVRRLPGGWGWRSPADIRAFAAHTGAEVINLQYQAAAYAMHPAINLLPRLLRGTPPLVVTFHDLRVPYLFPKAGALRQRAVLDLARGAAGVIVTNAEDEAVLRSAGVERVRAIPIGSNIRPALRRDFDPGAWKASRGLSPGCALFGYFGFLNESKGGETLLRALATLRAEGRDVALSLVGGQTGASDATNVSYAGRIDALAGALGVADLIHRTGFVDAAGVSEAFAACDALALPYRDGVSLRRGTLMAAFAHGAAIVTTMPRHPLPDLSDGDAFALVPSDDPAALAAALARVFDDAGYRARLQSGSLRASRLFAWENIAARTVEWLATLIRPS